MAIQAIETRYAGCRFRSRLEARWAVFFDTLGITWEYEPQGYEIGVDPETVSYLPDFWLPGLRLWVEVKGEMTQSDADKICRAACPHDGLPGSPNSDSIEDPSRCGNRVLVLGSIPRFQHGSLPAHAAHAMLRFWKGDLTAERVVFANAAEYILIPGYNPPIVWTDCGGLTNDRWIDLTKTYIIRSTIRTSWYVHPVAEAYDAARSARFEHGESG